MKCTECGYKGGLSDFRYLYNARIDGSMSIRQCPKCQVVLSCNELKEELTGTVAPGEAPWGKSAGIEGVTKE